ncbi:hypothetical protein C8J57DRAFT_1344803 [Mycena rebaudengoi]|nr:hypothetical protein C8J57DRAFT_1344803 [Mycena rebaudengoi]
MISDIDPPPVGANTMSTMEDTEVDNVALAFDVAEKLAGFVQTVPLIAPVARFFSQTVKVYKEVQSTDDKQDALLGRITVISSDLYATVLRIEAAGHVDFFKRDLEKSASLLEKAAALVTGYDQLEIVGGGATRNQLGGDLATLQQDIDSFGTRFRKNRLMDLSIQQNQRQLASVIFFSLISMT